MLDPEQEETDVKIFPLLNYRSEPSVAVHPFKDVLLLGANLGTGGVGIFWSMDAGQQWAGFDYHSSLTPAGDPAAVIDRNGFFYMGYISSGGQAIARSTNSGQTWNQVTVAPLGGTGLLDKNHLCVDNNPSSPYVGTVYSGWTAFVDGSPNWGEIAIARSTNSGVTWIQEGHISTAVNAGSHNQGVNLQTGPAGEVYAVWAIYDVWNPANGSPETAIGFSKSTDGGENWSPAVRIFDNIKGIRALRFLPYDIRTNSYPVIAVSQLTGAIFLVWVNQGYPGDNIGDPDVYLSASDDGGESWSLPTVIHRSDTDENQLFPWITVDRNTDAISVIFYDGHSYHPPDRTVEVTVSHSTDGGTFNDIGVGDVSFELASLGAFYHGDYIGIASRDGKFYPVWNDPRSGRSEIWISPPDVREVYVHQRGSNGSELVGTSIGWWESGFGFHYHPMPLTDPFYFSPGTKEVLKGSQEIEGNDKYTRWVVNLDLEGEPNVQNHHEFTIESDMFDLTSRFKQTYSGVTLKAELLDAPATIGGKLRFMDPWLIDYADPQYGNSVRNQGTAAPFMTQGSPFNPNSNPSGPDSEYKGVFLEESSIADDAHYRVKPHSNAFLAYESHLFKWETDPLFAAVFPPDLDGSSAVVFLQDNAIVTAIYKGQMISSTDQVTARNSSRRVIRDVDERYHMVYESAGSIWYTKSTNGGQTWSPEVLIFEENEDYTLREPSITVQVDPHKIAVTCEAVSVSLSEVSIPITLIDPQTGALTQETAVGVNDGTAAALPVIASAVDTDMEGTNYLLVVWYDPNGPSMKGQIRKEDGIWSGEAVLKNASVTQISVAPICAANGDKWHIVWKEGENLYYSQIDVGEGAPSLETPNFVLADGSAAEIEVDNPSVVRLFKSQGNPAVAWEEYNSELAKRRIKFRERLGNDPPTWTNVTVWSGSQNSQFYNPSLSGQHIVTDAFLAWRYGTSLKFVQRIGMTWTSTSNLAGGYDPMLAVGWDQVTQELAAYRKTTTQPYKIGITDVPPTPPPFARGGNPRAEMPNGRGGRVLYEGGMMHLVILEATLDGVSIPFVALNDTLPARTPGEFSEALKTEPFSGTGTLSFQVQYSASGTLPPEALYRATVRDAETDQLLSTARVFLGVEDTIMTVTIPLAFRNRSVRLVLQPTELSRARSLEVEQWFIVDEGDTTGATISAPVSASATTPEGIPQAFVLHQNYPNPFNPQTIIRYELPEGVDVTLRVYDVLGKELLTLVNEAQPAGYYETIVDGADLASGVYVYRLTAGNFTGTKKMLFIK